MAYKTIDETFWTDPANQSRNPMERYLLLYLITNPHTHYSGIYYLPKSFIVEETGLQLSKVNEFLSALPVVYDESLKIIWVKKMCKYQLRQGNKENLLKGISKHLSTLHNSLLIKHFLVEYEYLGIQFDIPSVWDGVSHEDGLGYPMPESVTGYIIQEQKMDVIGMPPEEQKPKQIKSKHGEFNNVLLTDEELSKLKNKFGDWKAKIEKLSAYLESKGVKYKSHYATIISWDSNRNGKPEPKMPEPRRL